MHTAPGEGGKDLPVVISAPPRFVVLKPSPDGKKNAWALLIRNEGGSKHKVGVFACGLVLPALPLKLPLMGLASVLQPGSLRAMLQPAGAPARGHQNTGVLSHASCHCYYNGQ